MCSQITDIVGGVILPEELSRTELPWKRWLFAESRRRWVRSSSVILIFVKSGMKLKLELAQDIISISRHKHLHEPRNGCTLPSHI